MHSMKPRSNQFQFNETDWLRISVTPHLVVYTVTLKKIEPLTHY